jgi:hypothetical protein
VTGVPSVPLKDETLLVAMIIRPAMEILVAMISVNPMIKSTAQVLLRRIRKSVKNPFRINLFFFQTSQKCYATPTVRA